MKRASYRYGVESIALNHDPDVLDQEDIERSMSVGLLADLFGLTVERVAGDVLRYRLAAQKRITERAKIWAR